MAGEFGRTTGPVTAAGGRDHLLQQTVVFAGAGVHGGKVIGATNAAGSDTVDFGWSRQRYVKPEDVEATIYSAMGINWTTVRCDDPFHRGFEYVPFEHEHLWSDRRTLDLTPSLAQKAVSKKPAISNKRHREQGAVDAIVTTGVALRSRCFA